MSSFQGQIYIEKAYLGHSKVSLIQRCPLRLTGDTSTNIFGKEIQTKSYLTAPHLCSHSLSLSLSLFQIYGAEFIETSAKTGYNVGNALMMLVR